MKCNKLKKKQTNKQTNKQQRLYCLITLIFIYFFKKIFSGLLLIFIIVVSLPALCADDARVAAGAKPRKHIISHYIEYNIIKNLL